MSDRVRYVVFTEMMGRDYNIVTDSPNPTHLLVPVDCFQRWCCQGIPGWGLPQLEDCPTCNGRGWVLQGGDDE